MIPSTNPPVHGVNLRWTAAWCSPLLLIITLLHLLESPSVFTGNLHLPLNAWWLRSALGLYLLRCLPELQRSSDVITVYLAVFGITYLSASVLQEALGKWQFFHQPPGFGSCFTSISVCRDLASVPRQDSAAVWVIRVHGDITSLNFVLL